MRTSLLRQRARLLPFLAVLVALLVQTGCAIPFLSKPVAQVSGTIYGEQLGATAASPTATVARATVTSTIPPRLPAGVGPVQATVTCNGVSTTADLNGHYRLSVPQADEYACTVRVSADYQTVNWTFPGKAGANLSLTLGPSAASACATNPKASATLCSYLRLRPGALSGTLVTAGTGQPLANVAVTCWIPLTTTAATAADPELQVATTDRSGAFTFTVLRPGAYSCHASGDPDLHQVTVPPGSSGTLSIRSCGKQCPAVAFHGGPVMHSVTAYLIFWLPPGKTLEPAGSDERFKTLIGHYFTDIGKTPFYQMLTQYWDYRGPVTDAVALGATSVDTTAYPHAGTRADPLSRDDVEAAVRRAQVANGWTADNDHLFVLFTAYNIESCVAYSSTKDCTFGAGNHYCAYHDNTPDDASKGNIIYSYVPVLQGCSRLDELDQDGSPNNDSVADATLNSLSHEHFEAVTDPTGDGWYDGDSSRGEIGDKCEYRFGNVQQGAGNLTLNNGRSYLLQAEWSNRSAGCVFK